MQPRKLIGWTWFIFVAIAAAILLYMFFFVDVGKTEKEITLKDNFDQTVFITADGALGSGVLVDSSLILTACHVVVKDSCNVGSPNLAPADHIMITVKGRTFAGVVTKYDPYADLAFVRLSSWQTGDLAPHVSPVTIACDPLQISRSIVYGIGHPHGMEKNIKSGLLSAEQATMPGWIMAIPRLHDMLSLPSVDPKIVAEYSGRLAREKKFFNIFDITLLPGNSGGGLFDEKGHLIGIVSHIIKHAEEGSIADMKTKVTTGVPSGYSYATKPERICEFMQEIIK